MASITQLPPILRHALEAWSSNYPKLEYHPVSTEDIEGRLVQEKNPKTLREGWQVVKNTRFRRYITFIGVATILTLLLTIAFSRRHQDRIHRNGQRNVQTLHLLITSSDSRPELCKAILSAEVLYYPTPTLVRWSGTGHDARENTWQQMIAVRNHLNRLAKRGENDTVILTNSGSVWFQLRPEVLLKRYYEINRRGNRRLSASLGLRVMLESGLQQSVVFAASSRCSASSLDSGACPESTLVGQDTHVGAPKYIDSSLVVGPAGAVHEIYRRAVAMMERSQDFTSESAIFSEIYAGQERQRQQLLRRESRSWLQAVMQLFTDSRIHDLLAGTKRLDYHRTNGQEFGIGLDCDGQLSLDPGTGPDNSEWMQHRNLPHDIVASTPPFWTSSGQGLPSDKTWSDVKLITSASTRAIPAVITHGNTTDTTQQNKQWESLWLHPYSRKLLDAYMSVPAMPLAAVLDNEGTEQVFWSPTIGERAGAKAADGRWHPWERLCKGQAQADEIFGDENGEWESPLP